MNGEQRCPRLLGQISPALESIWDYPATPLAEPTSARLQVIYNGFLVADSDSAVRVLLHGHAPQYYFPAEDVRAEYLVRSGYQTRRPAPRRSDLLHTHCWGAQRADAAWCFHQPSLGYEPLADRFAFHSGKIDAAFVDGDV